MLFEHDLECNEHGKTTEVNRLHQEYDERTFWEELPDRLGERDFFRKYSREEREKMIDNERFTKMMECIISWEEECEKYGTERLGIIKQVKDFE
jgi:mRNA deadenylase 3'-5' endonuclease subunit Ccr4